MEQSNQHDELFQSTPPMWGATPCPCYPPCLHCHFNLRPRMGGDHELQNAWRRAWQFQPTPPVWGATKRSMPRVLSRMIFQPTPPVWGATTRSRTEDIESMISTHAPRVGGDLPGDDLISRRSKISTHAPRVGGDLHHLGLLFMLRISTHAPRVGGDHRMSGGHSGQDKFQPTPPVWGATNSNSHCSV